MDKILKIICTFFPDWKGIDKIYKVSMSHSRRSRSANSAALYTPLLENGYEISAEGTLYFINFQNYYLTVLKIDL